MDGRILRWQHISCKHMQAQAGWLPAINSAVPSNAAFVAIPDSLSIIYFERQLA